MKKMKRTDYHEFILDTGKVIPKYLIIYLNSPWGRKFILKLINDKDSLIGENLTVKKSELYDLVVALPNRDIQKELIYNIERMDKVSTIVEEMKRTIVINPVSSEITTQNIDKILNAVDEVSPLLREESISHEFKASLRTPYPDYPPLEISKEGKEIFKLGKHEFLSKKQIQNFMQEIVLKAIASLLNTQGGQLVIGVHEFGNIKEVVGIDREGFESHDEYERHLIQLLKNAFGAAVIADFISTKIEKIDDKPVCVVTCKQYNGDELIWFKEKLYIRTGPRIDELRGREQAQFILQRQQNRKI